MGNHSSFNLNHKEQLQTARINSLSKDPTLGMLPMEKLGKVLHYLFFLTPLSVGEVHVSELMMALVIQN